MPLRTCAAAVAPAEVPITRSAASVRSRPASARPAMMPISHAFPAAPPPPRTSATRDVDECALPPDGGSDSCTCDISWSFSGKQRCRHPRSDDGEALKAPACGDEYPTMNKKNGTHLLYRALP